MKTSNKILTAVILLAILPSIVILTLVVANTRKTVQTINNINIGSMEDRERSQSEIADVIRNILADYPQFKKIKVTEGGGGMGGASTVDVEIYGYDFETGVTVGVNRLS